MNNPTITAQTLIDFGIVVSPDEEASLLQHLNDTLDERVGAEIAESLDDEQLKTLLDLQDKGDDEKTFAWILVNVPDVAEIRQDEVDILLGEIAANADNLSSS